jgi:hypothetical protein
MIPVLYTAGATGALAIVNALGDVYYLPPSFTVRTVPSAKRIEPYKVAYANGAKDVSDGKFSERTLELAGTIFAETDEDYRALWDEIASQLLVNEDYYLRAGTRQIKIKRCSTLNEDWPEGARLRIGNLAASLVALDPFWYKTTAAVVDLATAGATTYGFSFLVGGTVECHPVIRVECLAANADFTIENTGDGSGRAIRVQDPAATAGTVIEIDCAAGTVIKDGATNIIQYASGLFPRLLPNRINLFEYTGASANVRFTYYWAWL